MKWPRSFPRKSSHQPSKVCRINTQGQTRPRRMHFPASCRLPHTADHSPRLTNWPARRRLPRSWLCSCCLRSKRSCLGARCMQTQQTSHIAQRLSVFEARAISFTRRSSSDKALGIAALHIHEASSRSAMTHASALLQVASHQVSADASWSCFASALFLRGLD